MVNSTHTYDTYKNLSPNQYSLEGYTFKGWSTSSDGLVVYNDEASVINLRASGSFTLYAVWEANTYEVIYDKNTPTNTSNAVSGVMVNSTHTYDTYKNLSPNQYSLEGYTFKGWATSSNGLVVYNDEASVINLRASGSITLYAVWEANSYTVRYDSNKPIDSTGTINGMVADSIHKYDEIKSLNGNNYVLPGYTFKGWSTSANGTVDYKDGEDVKNLSSVNNGVANLYAVWEANKYTITFNTTGGSYVNNIQVIFDEAFLKIVPPTRKGYNFEGYYTLPNGKGIKYYNADGTAIFTKYTNDSNITLYAEWSPVVYNIELYSQGKYVGIVENVVYGYMRLPSCEDLGIIRANYDFVGWNIYEDQNWSMYNANFDYNTGLGEYDGQTVILNAAWLEKNIYSINYNANGGMSAPGMMQVHEEETITLSTLTPTRENYKFLGWSTSTEAVTVEYLPGDAFTMGSSVVTLYAVWELNPSLTYDANGGKFTSQIGKLYPQEGSNVTITSIIPVQEGYEFIGWNEDKEATIGNYNAGDTLIMSNVDTVLYAIWKKAEYTITKSVADGYTVNGLSSSYKYNDEVTFTVTGTKPKIYVNGELITPVNDIYSFVIVKDTQLIVADGTKISLIYSGNGGINEPVDRKSYDNNTYAEISTVTPSRTGYQFLGWATTKEAPLPEYTSGSVIDLSTDDVVLYAVWEANNYQIIYDANGGNGIMDSDSLAYDSTFTLSNNTYKKSGYTFKGWALDPNGEKMYNDGETVSNLSSINGDNITLYAIWKKTVTQITFVTIDGTETNMPITIDYGTDLDTSDFNKPIRVGYIFSGYYTGMNGTGDLIIDANLNSTLSNGWDLDVNSLTLYSHWTPITYSIVYMNGQTVCREQKVSYDSVFNLISFMQMGITVPTGYHFAGWSTVPSSKTIAYSDNQNITYALEKTEGSKVFLYAVFEVNQKYNIIYNANGGINAPIDSNTYFVGDIITIPSTIPTLEGYKFLGWSYDYENNPIDFPYENNAFTIPTLTMTEEGITLYAVWIEEKTLQNQINEVNVQIDLIQTSISDLNNTNSDFADKIDQLTIKMQNTQDVLDSLDSTYVTYAELNEAIAKLKSELLQADEVLQNAINKVQANLDKAVTDLNETISNNKDDIESKLNAAVKAYEDANVIINSKFASIAIKHEEFANLFDSLKEDLKTAEEKIWKEINDLQDDLKKLKEEMNKKDNELEEMIKSLTENTEKDKNYLDTISYINLGLIVTLAVAVIIIVLFFKRKMKNY